MTSPDGHSSARSTYAMRRAPRLGVFLGLGVLVGAIVGGIVATLVHSGDTPPTDPFTGVPLEFGSTVGIGVIVFGLLGALLASLIWLLMDRRSRKTTATYVLESTDDPAAADVRLHRREVAEYNERWGISSPADAPSEPAAPEDGVRDEAPAIRKDTAQ